MSCSSDPPGIKRARTASASRIAEGPFDSELDAPRLAINPSYGSTRPACPRSASARHNSSACQPGLLSTTTCIPRRPLREQGLAQDVHVHPSRMERPSARAARQRDLGRAEEHRVDLIEI